MYFRGQLLSPEMPSNTFVYLSILFHFLSSLYISHLLKTSEMLEVLFLKIAIGPSDAWFPRQQTLTLQGHFVTLIRMWCGFTWE